RGYCKKALAVCGDVEQRSGRVREIHLEQRAEKLSPAKIVQSDPIDPIPLSSVGCQWSKRRDRPSCPKRSIRRHVKSGTFHPAPEMELRTRLAVRSHRENRLTSD